MVKCCDQIKLSDRKIVFISRRINTSYQEIDVLVGHTIYLKYLYLYLDLDISIYLSKLIYYNYLDIHF